MQKHGLVTALVRGTCPYISLVAPLHQLCRQRSPWLRAFVLGVNDGLVSVAALVGVDQMTMKLFP